MALIKAFAVGIITSVDDTVLTTGTFDSTGYTHLVVFTKHEGATTTITPSDNKSSTGWSSLTKQANGVSDSWGQLHWVKIGSPGTGHTVTMTLALGRPFRSIVVWLVDADSGDIALDAQTTATASSSTPDAGSLATTGASVVSFMGVAEYAVLTYTQGSGWTEDYDNETYGQSRGPETTSPIDPVCTASGSQNWAACAASFRELTGGSSIALFANHLIGLMGA